jgi:unspecific monooxygenase
MALSADLGPIFQRKLLGERLVIVAGGRLANQCRDEEHWARALAGPGATLRKIRPNGLFTVRTSNPLWGQARRILQPGFTQASMRIYHDAMNSVADDLIEEWSRATGPVDVDSGMTRAAVEVIGRAGFSRDLGLFHPTPDAAESRRFVRELADVLKWAAEATNDVPVIGQLRALYREPRVRRQNEAMLAFVHRIIAERRRADNAGEGSAGEGGAGEGSDLLDLMLNTVDPETGRALPLDNVADQVITLLIAGHETTAALVEVALHYLAQDPELQERLVADIRGRGGFGYDAVAGMRTVRNLLDECLRLWPTAPGFFRLARHDQDLGGYLIPEGRAVFVLNLAAHRDPDVWGPTAGEFDPGRFEAAALREYPDRFFAPWGTGPRACIGRAFAAHEATLLVARLLDRFTLGGGGTLRLYERATLRPYPFSIELATRAST